VGLGVAGAILVAWCAWALAAARRTPRPAEPPTAPAGSATERSASG
jgi:hypothetical protein